MSYDYEFGYKYSVPFGGFFSCNEGNPLAANRRLLTTAARFSCGDGYSQHVAAIDNDCLINYCVKANSFGSGQKDIPIVLPPFQNYDEMFAEEFMLKEIPIVLSRSPIVLGTLFGITILILCIVCYVNRIYVSLLFYGYCFPDM